MKSLAKKALKPWRRLSARFARPLPIGMRDFHRFCDECLGLYGLPDNETTRHAIASMIMHLPPTQKNASKHYFGACLHKAMANEVAYQFMEDHRKTRKAGTAVVDTDLTEVVKAAE